MDLKSTHLLVGYRRIDPPPTLTALSSAASALLSTGESRPRTLGRGLPTRTGGARGRGTYIWIPDRRRKPNPHLPSSYPLTRSPALSSSSTLTPSMSSASTMSTPPSSSSSSTTPPLLFLLALLLALLLGDALLIYATFHSSNLSTLFELCTVLSLLDGLVGSLFMAVWLWLRNGPPLLMVRARTFALATLFIGCYACVPYLIMLLVCGYPLLPTHNILFRTHPHLDSIPPARVRRLNAAVVITAVGCLLGLVVCRVYVLSRQQGVDQVKRSDENGNVLYLGVCLHTVIGLVVVAFYIKEREGGWWSFQVVIWVLALFALGNMATCGYVMVVATQAWRKKVTVASAALCESRALEFT